MRDWPPTAEVLAAAAAGLAGLAAGLDTDALEAAAEAMAVESSSSRRDSEGLGGIFALLGAWRLWRRRWSLPPDCD